MMNFALALRHYFFPGHSNNHKAKIIHSSSIFLISFILLVYQLILQSFPIIGVKVLGYAAFISTDEVIKLTNAKRLEAGLPPLSYNPKLAEAARKKGEHMLQYDYWAHIAPDGTEPWKFFVDEGYRYRYAGENLARDFSNAADVVNAWLASPSHRENMLSSKYKEIGVAVVEGDLGGVDTTLVVQFFGTSQSGVVAQVPGSASSDLNATSKTTEITITPTPTLIPQGFAFVSPEPTKMPTIASLPSQKEGFRVLISPFQTTKGISIATTLVLLVVMVIDGLVVARNRIPRVGGRTFAHLAFLGMILAIVLVARAGEIL